MPMLGLLRHRQVMLLMFRDAPLAPALRLMLDEGARVVDLRHGEHRPLILPQNKGYLVGVRFIDNGVGNNDITRTIFIIEL